MGQKSLPTPVVAGIIAVVLFIAAFFVYRSVTGGQVTNGTDSNGQASPPGQGPQKR